MRNYPFKTIVACLSIFWHSPHLWAADAVTPDTAVLDTIEVRGKRLTKDQKGEAQQYSKNVSNAYLGKEYLERYRPDAAGDILKGAQRRIQHEYAQCGQRDYAQHPRHRRKRPHPRYH